MFIRPSLSDLGIPEFRTLLKNGDGDLLKLERPLYDQEDSGKIWHHTIDLHTINDLKMLYFPGLDPIVCSIKQNMPQNSKCCLTHAHSWNFVSFVHDSHWSCTHVPKFASMSLPPHKLLKRVSDLIISRRWTEWYVTCDATFLNSSFDPWNDDVAH